MPYEGTLLGGLAAAYFAATFIFAGYVIKVHVELREELRGLKGRFDKFKYLEILTDQATEEALANFAARAGGDAPAPPQPK